MAGDVSTGVVGVGVVGVGVVKTHRVIEARVSRGHIKRATRRNRHPRDRSITQVLNMATRNMRPCEWPIDVSRSAVEFLLRLGINDIGRRCGWTLGFAELHVVLWRRSRCWYSWGLGIVSELDEALRCRRWYGFGRGLVGDARGKAGRPDEALVVRGSVGCVGAIGHVRTVAHDFRLDVSTVNNRAITMR